LLFLLLPFLVPLLGVLAIQQRANGHSIAATAKMAVVHTGETPVLHAAAT
jgi:hypothetical protein